MIKLAIFLLAMLANTCARAALPERLVCYDDVFVPYFMAEGGAFTGLSKDVLTEAASRIGIAIEFRQLPWRRLEAELEHRALPCAFALSRTSKREQYLDFGKVPMHPTDYTLFVRADGADTLDALEGKTIGVRAGVRLPAAIAAGAQSGRFKLAEVSSDTVNFQKLSLKRVDAVLSDAVVGMYTLRQLHLDGVHRLAPPLIHFDTYVVFPKSEFSAELAAAFDRAFEKMHQDGSYERLVAAYEGKLASAP